ncbi:MAG: asparagine synthetase B family protein, partial [Gammaproteobacteria bacterium]
IRLRADVPVGAYLSGGLDSSAIAALIQASGHPALTTFSLTFDDPGLDESEYQAVVRTHIGSAHHALPCTATDVVQGFQAAILRTETPILRSAPVPMMCLSKAVRQTGHKVVLTGEGADEVLGGYDLFKETKIRQFWARQPESPWRPRLLERLYPYLELGQADGAAALKPFFGHGIGAPDAWHFSHQPRWQTTGLLRDFLRAEHRSRDSDAALSALQQSLPAGFSQWHPFNRAQYLESRTLMSGYLLSSQGDRMLMANSIEGRFPFLDHRIIEFAARLHPRLKMRGLNEKYLLKQALRRDLPSSVLNRHKQPYRAPDIQAFFAAGQLPEWVESELAPNAVRDAGIFNEDTVGLLLRKIRRRQSGSARENMAFLGILSTQVWWRQFLRGTRRTAPSGIPSQGGI